MQMLLQYTELLWITASVILPVQVHLVGDKALVKDVVAHHLSLNDTGKGWMKNKVGREKDSSKESWKELQVVAIWWKHCHGGGQYESMVYLA